MDRYESAPENVLTLDAILEALEDNRHESCTEKSNGYCCDRRPGHTGPHVSVMGDGDQIAQVWRNNDTLMEQLFSDDLTKH